MAGRIEHPVLGPIAGDSWEWQGQWELHFPCLGYSTRNMSIVVKDSASQPSVEQVQGLLELKAKPQSFRDEMARAIFTAYSERIRPEYLDTLAELGACIFSEEDLVEISSSESIWQIVTGLHYIWVDEDASVNVHFNVTFDIEHVLEVTIRGGRIDAVRMQ